MKKTILMILMILLTINIVGAVTAGSTETIHTFDKCETLKVTVTGLYTIDDGEYSFEGCTEIFNNSWFCDCYNNYNLTLKTDLLTQNNYTMVMTSFYKGETITATSSGGSSGSRSRSYYQQPVVNFNNSINATEPMLVIIPELETVPVVLNESEHEGINDNIPTPAPVDKVVTPIIVDTNNSYTWLWMIAIILLILTTVVAILKFVYF